MCLRFTSGTGAKIHAAIAGTVAGKRNGYGSHRPPICVMFYGKTRTVGCNDPLGQSTEGLVQMHAGRRATDHPLTRRDDRFRTGIVIASGARLRCARRRVAPRWRIARIQTPPKSSVKEFRKLVPNARLVPSGGRGRHEEKGTLHLLSAASVSPCTGTVRWHATSARIVCPSPPVPRFQTQAEPVASVDARSDQRIYSA